MFVKVKLNEHRNLSFLVDTGSAFSVIFTDSVLQLPTQYKLSSIRGFGKLDSIPAQVSAYNTLSLGALTSYGHQMLVVDKNMVGFQQYFDRPLHGIIGFDVLRNFDLEINFISQKLIFRKTRSAKKQNKKWVTIPFDVQNNSLLVRATISVNQQTDSIKLILDTGSQLPLLLPEQYAPSTALRTIIGLGFLGYTSGWIGKIDSLRIGDIKQAMLIASFPDSASVTWNPKLPQRGNLGLQFLKQFRVIINFNEHYLQLKPLRKYFRQSHNFNRSGMAIRSVPNAKCAYFVDEVVSGSPADKAGFQTDDRIISIKEIGCPDLSLALINNNLFSENAALKIEILRKNVPQMIILDLRE